MKDIYKINVNNTDYILKFTFNSFKFIDDLELGTDYSQFPLKTMTLTYKLLYGALNWARDKYYNEDDVDAIFEGYLQEDGDVQLLMKNLISMLNETNFFKALQKKEGEKGEPKKAKK